MKSVLASKVLSPPYLALDLGNRFIGTAFSEAGILVKPGQTFDRQGKTDNQIFNQMTNLIIKQGIQTLVVGLPINPNGSENDRCDKIHNFIQKFECFLNNQGYKLKAKSFFPEDFSSIDAKHQISKNYKIKQKQPSNHSLAAKIILERFLENFSEEHHFVTT